MQKRRRTREQERNRNPGQKRNDPSTGASRADDKPARQAEQARDHVIHCGITELSAPKSVRSSRDGNVGRGWPHEKQSSIKRATGQWQECRGRSSAVKPQAGAYVLGWNPFVFPSSFPELTLPDYGSSMPKCRTERKFSFELQCKEGYMGSGRRPSWDHENDIPKLPRHSSSFSSVHILSHSCVSLSLVPLDWYCL